MPASAPLVQTACYHCGDTLPDPPLVFHDKAFCCEGCKTVFQILDENGLCTYYDLEKHPGISLKNAKAQARFAYLDSTDITAKLIEYQDERQVQLTFYLPQIHCSSCLWLLENLHRLHAGVQHAKVNFLKKEIHLSLNPNALSLRQAVELLASIGYEPEINLHDISGKKQRSYNRQLIFQLGVAGFCFGNIMLLSFPEYLSLGSYIEEEFRGLFGYLNMVLALPVLLYSATGYYRSAWLSLREKRLNIDVPITLGIIALFGRSAFEILTHSGAGYMDSLVALVFFLLIGKWFQGKTYDTLSFERDYEAYFPVAVTRRAADGSEASVAVTQLEEGDTIVIRHQELIPADAVLLSEEAGIDYSFVTGESEPVRRRRGDLVYAGGRQTGGAIELRLTRKVSQSYLTRLWNHESFQTGRKDKDFATLSDQMGQRFTWVVLTVAFVSAGYWLWHSDAGLAVNVFTAVLIIACPCALALNAPFTLGNAMRILGRHRMYLKNTTVIERMAKLDTLVFDKTGTLTERSGEAAGNFDLNPAEQRLLRGLVRHSAHPVSRAILASLPPGTAPEISEFQEITGQGISGIVEGHSLRLGSAAFTGADRSDSESDRRSGAWLCIDGVLRGRFDLHSRYREGLQEVTAQLNPAYRLALLSGDHDGERERLGAFFQPGTDMRFGQSPHDKLAHIEALQGQGRQVMMLGDGLNDAGALRQSDVGVAVSEDINTFSPACDAILDASRFRKLPRLLAYSRGSVRLVKAGFLLSLGYNVVGLSFAVQGLLQPVVAAILMPLSSVTVVSFAVISTTLLGKRLLGEAETGANP